MLWEWLLLAGDSPLRRFLNDAAERDGLGRGAFGFLPELGFRGIRARGVGEVERVRLAALPRSLARRRELALIAGRSLALFSWLGVADLHWENLVLGVDARGRTIFAPLDIEMMFGDLSLPTETKLLPDADPEYAEVCRHACGLRRVLPYLGKPLAARELLAMASSYRVTLEFLDRHARSIAELLSALPGLREAPIRVCLRGTADYMRADTEALWPPGLDAEREQLERGDIPYFFRLYGRAGIRYYANRALSEQKRLPSRGDVPQLDPLLQLSRGLAGPNRVKLRREGLLCILGAFDHSSLDGRHALDDFVVTFGARRIVAKLPDGEEFHAHRDLSAFVGSAYLTCRCGEVREPFVPAVTRCRPGSFAP